MTSVVQALMRSDIHGLHLAIGSGKWLRRGLCDSSRLAHTAWRIPSGATRSKPRVRERCRRDGTLGQAAPYTKSPTGATLKTGKSKAEAYLL